ncbi:variant erythrocyte surface antigen-1 family protein, partial [Babesia divergens]
MARMVCYMYYTDVFVGTNNIVNLNKALNVELEGSYFNSNDLTQLVQGLCLFMGYPSCLCSLKVNVNESLKDISKKLKKDFEAVQSCASITTLNLNCSNCNSNDILCKCCVISCIKELPTQSKSQCDCVKNASQKCLCQGTKGKCCKDFLSGLEACLSLLNLQTDLAGCTCNDPKTCCENGTCIKSCPVCDPKISTITGLGLSRPNPVRLAKRLSGMLCGTRDQTGQKCNCDCGSGTQNTSCCCFCHKGCKTGQILSDLCSNACTPGCSCASKPGECGLKDFCKSINTIRVLVGSGEMTCCSKGADCHCVSDSGLQACSGSALNCCVVTVQGKSGKDHFQHSVKCMILRVVKFFKDFPLDASSPSKCLKLCCELICVGKYCEFLKMFYNKGNKDSCETCKSGGSSGKCPGSTLQSPSTSCCGGKFESCSNTQCCLGCQDCDAIKFRKALETLKLSSPCGQDLYRTLKDFLDYCLNVAEPFIKSVKDKINAAKKKCVSGCSSSGTPCSCSNCLGCQDIRDNHKDIMSVLTRKFSSSYDSSNAKWDSLCSSSSPCCGSSSSNSSSCSCSCSSNPSSCDPKDCCEKCPKRLCARIFLGMLPCLYYGLKIVFDRCKENSGFAGWHDITMDSKGNPSSDLAKFLYAWGYGLRPFISKKGTEFFSLLEKLFGSDKIFKSLYDFVSQNYFVPSVSPGSISPNSSPPTTVREMLLWLYGLRFQKSFPSLVSHCSSLCIPFGKSFHPDAFCYYIHTSCFLVPVSVISAIQRPHGSPSFFPPPSYWKDFCYPENPSKLFETFCEYVRKIFAALNFLSIQCKNGSHLAGWQFCYFGKTCALKFQSSLSSPPSSVPSSGCSSCSGHETYLCSTKSGNPVHDHCRDGQTCRGFSGSCDSKAHSSGKTCSIPCPHHLVRFLIDGSENSKNLKNLESPFQPPEDFPKMGFKAESLISPGRNGLSLHDVLKVFCDDGFYPLTRLAEFILCVSQRPPESLFDLYAFFKKFVEALNSKSELSSRFVQWINDEPGWYPATMLKTALEQLYGSKTSHSSSSHTPANLFSLSGCHANIASKASCGPYLHPLTDKASGVFTKELCSMYLSWICYLAKDFKALLEEFHKEAQEKFSCCTSCTKIVECPCALPFLYSWGFQFNSPNSLNGNSKKCSEFLAQLKNVLEGSAPLSLLLSEIETFLW